MRVSDFDAGGPHSSKLPNSLPTSIGNPTGLCDSDSRYPARELLMIGEPLPHLAHLADRLEKGQVTSCGRAMAWWSCSAHGLGPRRRWCKLLETGAYGTIEELAAAEKINVSYVSRVLRLSFWHPISSKLS
jgi:hypothetical protein